MRNDCDDRRQARDASHAEGRAQQVHVWRHGVGDVEDLVAVEEPLEIRIDGRAFAVTLRTPGDDEELAVGFVLSEGLAATADDILSITRVNDVAPSSRGNIVDVRLASNDGNGHRPVAHRTGQPRFITASCGVCGEGTIDRISRRAGPLPDGRTLASGLITELPARLLAAQTVFAETGGLHAAGLFDFEGHLIVAREDVGRHNAVDKVIGFSALQGRLPLRDTALLVSGRAGFEIVVKAWMAGIPVLASVSAPSQLAVHLAEEANMALAGFVRDGSYAVYAGRHRLQ